MMTQRFGGLCAVAVVAAGLLAGAPRTADGGPTTAYGGPTRGGPGARTLLGDVAPGTTIDVGLILRMRDPAAIERYLTDLVTPGSANYRRFLKPGEFGARFGQPLQRIAEVEAWARASGLTVLGGFPQRTAIRVRGTAGQIGNLFGVRLDSYVDPVAGVAFRSPRTAPIVPPALADAVAGLSGLDNRPAHPRSLHAAGMPAMDVPPAGLGPTDLAKA